MKKPKNPKASKPRKLTAMKKLYDTRKHDIIKNINLVILNWASN